MKKLVLSILVLGCMVSQSPVQAIEWRGMLSGAYTFATATAPKAIGGVLSGAYTFATATAPKAVEGVLSTRLPQAINNPAVNQRLGQAAVVGTAIVAAVLVFKLLKRYDPRNFFLAVPNN